MLPAGFTGHLWLKGLHPSLPGWDCPLRGLTGIPCPTCFLTRATSAALTGNLSESLHWHAFGPIAAAGLVGWSVLAIQRRELLPFPLRAGTLGWGAGALLAYWAVRLGLSFTGLQAFPP
ncbi:DUF2752 domain-containing protein [Synechococcus sp. CB0101]|nr:DUF2752 domain-containing protein [Synechococcus sp. CB0101]